MPMPAIWVEVFYTGKDQKKAMLKIQNDVSPNNSTTLVLGLALPDSGKSRKAAPAVVPTTAATLTTTKPPQAPWMVMWTPGATFGAAQYCKVEWNKHLPIPGHPNLDFNDILTELA
eukprot:TRINITY_DN104186_c0_g1_i1.p1 TRINITY_DN104186_c0_g1~~TRINITY_DN104186_c0_g1_i1.p1  ORF type:complete len:126 (-),score=23.36 TRINITY_DN104186_c0_g1_i1:181-528(-)